ncbi:MAG: dipicolinate synthase subunit B [Bacilli bacterium]
MDVKGKVIGWGLTGSHCTYSEVFPVIEELIKRGAIVHPVVTGTVMNTTTRFGKGADHLQKLEEITGNKVIDSIAKAEPLGPRMPLDVMVIAPLTGNSMSKMANAQTDSPVLMAAKATLRNGKPVVLAVSTNDGLGLNGSNIMRLISTKNIYFVPFGQDDPVKKPNSLVARMSSTIATIEAALENTQIQPVLVEKFKDNV